MDLRFWLIFLMTAKLLIDKESGKSLGFAYIWFVKEESAQLAAKKMNGKVCTDL
jgi:RNA recognition motif-containing protein